MPPKSATYRYNFSKIPKPWTDQIAFCQFNPTWNDRETNGRRFRIQQCTVSDTNMATKINSAHSDRLLRWQAGKNATARLVKCGIKLAIRYPWIIPIFGFLSGVSSFYLVERKQEHFAQIMSILMLASWVWLALEGLLQRGVTHWFKLTLPPAALRYVTQLVQQESLFFVIPFFFITTAWNSGQMVFTSLLIAATLVSIIDPLYYRWLAQRRWLYFIFHGVTLFAVLSTTLPLIIHMPTPKSHIWSLVIATLLTCPVVARTLSNCWWKRLLLFLLLAVMTCTIGLLARPWIPPASLWLTDVAITDHLNDRDHLPGQTFKTITQEKLANGVYAYTAIHAPRGLHETIYHHWRLNGKDVDIIPLDITGGRELGYRSWSHKVNFPADSLGNWQILVMTGAQQVIGVLRFKVISLQQQAEILEEKKRHQRSGLFFDGMTEPALQP